MFADVSCLIILNNLSTTCLKPPFSPPKQANFDTKIIVSTTCEPSQGLLTCNDDASGCSGYTSLTPTVSLTAGTRYYVIVGGCVLCALGG